jgi:ABC-type sulfate/molybdate transport systems ATPase subunit/ABC-type sulfate transport system permease component
MKSWVRSPLPWLGGLLALYLIAPFGALFGRLDHGVWSGIHQSSVLSALRVSAGAATVATLLITLTGVPLAYVFARNRSWFLRPIELLIYLPLALPPLVSGILLLFLFGPYTTLGQLFGGGLTDSFTGVVIAQMFVAAPFLVVAARAAFTAVDPTLETVAATLGRRPFSRFVRVSLRLAWPGILAGMLLTWLRAFGEFGATIMVAYHPYTLPVYTYVSFGIGGLDAVLAPVVVAIAAALAVVGLARIPWAAVIRRHRSTRLPAPEKPSREAQPEPRLSFELAKHFRGFELELAHNAESRRLALLGASGAGKSLTLQLIAGTIQADDGTVALGSHQLGRLPPEDRRVGYVPQDYALFPHLDVWHQLTFAPDANPSVASYWLTRLGLEGLERRLPAQLSGGQRQRVALARALSREPQLLLLDEPLSALDAPVRAELRRHLRTLQHELAATTIVVTHDAEEAALLADELLVLDNGRLIQAGSTGDVLSNPASPQVARLLGIPNIHTGRAVESGAIQTDGILIFSNARDLSRGQPVTWCIRPNQIQISPNGTLPATVIDAVDLPTVREATLQLAPNLTLIVHDPDKPLQPGDRCHVTLPPNAIYTWPGAGPVAELDQAATVTARW